MTKNTSDSAQDLRTLLLQMAEERGPEKTFCPSEVARLFAPEGWRDQMEAVRQVAGELVREGRLCCTQKGRVVEPETAKGPIRLARKS